MKLEFNPDSFMTGLDPFIELVPQDLASDRHEYGLVFEDRHEGFIGIPHGGLAMGLCLDQWLRMDTIRYPFHVSYKFGGSGLPIGTAVTFTVSEAGSGESDGAVMEIVKPGDRRPYLRAEIGPAPDTSGSAGIFEIPADEGQDLPYYRNCFVCGRHRDAPGLQRRFRAHRMNGSPVTTVPWGEDESDFQKAKSFLVGKDQLHPTALISIFDENTAWAGFMETGSAALSVRLELTLLRPVGRMERLLFIGRPAGIRGNPKAPRFFKADGTVLSMADPRNPEPVAFGGGEWITMKSYTRQIKENLLPRDDYAWIFPE